MKKLLTLILAIVVVAPTVAFSQPEVSEEKNVLKINTLSLIVGTGSIFYERKISDFTSAQLGTAFISFGREGTKFTGLILTPEVRFYVKSNAIDGFYLAPYFRYQNFTLKDDEIESKATYTNYGGGLAFGRQWITNSGFTMDLFFGGHYGSGKIEAESGGENFSTGLFEGFRTRVGFAIGFAF
jgi:hypothetical protein